MPQDKYYLAGCTTNIDRSNSLGVDALTAPLNSDASKLSYNTSLKYVKENYPELTQFFDDMWEIANSAPEKRKKASVQESLFGINFVGDESIQLVVNVVIPFITGVASSLFARGVYQRHLNSREATKIVKSESEKLAGELRIPRKTAEALLQDIMIYLQKELESQLKEQKLTQKAEHLEELLDYDLAYVYALVLEDEDVKELLNHVQNAHPNFTSHGPDHSENIIANLEKLVPPTLRKEFTPLEILVLLCSAWLHDIGMADFEGKLAECENEDERRNLSNTLRKTHALRSENYIVDSNNYSRLHLGAALAEIIGAVCKAHINEYDLMKLKTKWGPVHGYEKYGEVRVRLLAALLRLADACDLGCLRVKEVLRTVYNIPKNYVESIPHIEGALLITGIVIKNKAIIVQATPRDSTQLEWVKFLTKMLEEDFSSVKPVLLDKRENGIAFPYKEVKLETLEIR